MAHHLDFVQWFRAAAPYIHAFRGKTFVLAFGGEVVNDGKFIHLTHDINLLVSLGVRLVLVHGARPQIEALLAERNLQSHYQHGVRITDSATLKCVKQAVGQVRVEIEALLSMGLANSPMAGASIRVDSGNFVIAKPLGVSEGVDLQYSGQVRKVQAHAIQTRLDDGDIVMLSPLGYSPTGEIFNVTLEDVATHAAIALQADKLIFLSDTAGLTQDGKLLRELTAQSATDWLAHNPHTHEDTRLYLPCAIRATREGVKRAHLISRHEDGGLLSELFTHQGIGSMITRDALVHIRQAQIDDVASILAMLEPLEQAGVLVKRGRERLEMEINHFIVLVHDERIVGCAALYPYPETHMAELACVVVASEARGRQFGEQLLQYAEQHAQQQGLNALFVLTTQTAHWFIERGFAPASVSDLPEQKKALYNYQRQSKVFVKRLPQA